MTYTDTSSVLETFVALLDWQECIWVTSVACMVVSVMKAPVRCVNRCQSEEMWNITDQWYVKWSWRSSHDHLTYQRCACYCCSIFSTAEMSCFPSVVSSLPWVDTVTHPKDLLIGRHRTQHRNIGPLKSTLMWAALTVELATIRFKSGFIWVCFCVFHNWGQFILELVLVFVVCTFSWL